MGVLKVDPAVRERAAETDEARNLPRMLAESARYAGSYVHATPGQIDTLVLAAAASHVCEPGTLVSIPRILLTSKYPESGKTHTMRVTASLCYQPMDTTGTWYGVQSGIAEAAQQGAQCPTFIRDEIAGVFGDNGLGNRAPQLADICRQGYLCDAKSAWSVNRQRVEFSTFSLFLMTGLRAAVPRDVRTRCIVIDMLPGEPPQYYDLRDARARAAGLAKSLGRAVRGNRAFIRDFRIRDVGDPRLVKRLAEVWEPLFAVAAAADAQSGTRTWRDRAIAAFLEVAMDENGEITLSPDQEIVRDAVRATELMELLEWHGEPFVSGLALRDALREVDPGKYGRLPGDVLSCRLRDALTDEFGEPLHSVQVWFGDRKVRGYPLSELTAAWDTIRPRDPSDDLDDEIADFFADEYASGASGGTRVGEPDAEGIYEAIVVPS